MKKIKIVLPDNLHDELQAKASEAEVDLPAYILALLAEGSSLRRHFPKASAPLIPPAPPTPKPTIEPEPPVSHRQAPGGKKGPQSNFSVVIRWDLVGKGQAESIRLKTAAATLVQVLSRVSKKLGPDILPRLTSFRVSRGPIVSKRPDRDFVNGVSGKLYSHQELPGTDLFVRTHSSTAEKIKDLKELLRFLGEPSRLFEITKHPKT
jgi:hypothetical protein